MRLVDGVTYHVVDVQVEVAPKTAKGTSWDIGDGPAPDPILVVAGTCAGLAFVLAALLGFSNALPQPHGTIAMHALVGAAFTFVVARVLNVRRVTRRELEIAALAVISVIIPRFPFHGLALGILLIGALVGDTKER